MSRPRRSDGITVLRAHAATVAAAVVAALSVAVPGCGSRASDRPPRCGIVVDVSASVAADQRARYLDEATAALRRCTGGRAYADVADANARAGRCTPVDMTLAAPDPRGNTLFDSAAETGQVDRAIAATRALVDCAAALPATATDLFGAFVLAGAALRAGPAGRRELTVFTDGISTRAPYDLSARELDDADINRLLDQLASDGLMADLTGVDVRIVGAGVGADELGPVRLGRVETAWRSYVNRAGGTVSRYAKTLGGI
ncbi:hypothetical protein [Frankia sp. CiP1_Cm_nod2]|uniref:hypothetical protein n=1 Tax=Frankia sp. CiP1_Cm_nod2 TaxID=2897161 RepID=UPI002025950D